MDWQTVSALTIVGLALAGLLRHVAQAWQGTATTGCSHCPSRASSEAVKSLPLVQIEPLASPNRIAHSGTATSGTATSGTAPASRGARNAR